MATETLSGPLGEWRAASTAGGGTALSTTAVRIPLLRGTKQVQLIPRNFSTAVVAKFNVNPYLLVLLTADALATSPTDYSENAQDLSASTDVTLSSMDTAANSDYLYVGSHQPFSGAEIDVDAANANASVLTVKYRKSDNTWADITATDGTASGGAAFAIDGNVTWTMPTDWITCKLRESADTALNFGFAQQDLWWTRWQVSAALDSSTTLNSLIAINRNTAYGEIPSGFSQEFAVTTGPGGVFSVTALTDAGTANLIVNCATRATGLF